MNSTTTTIVASVGSAVVAMIATAIAIGTRPRSFEAGPYLQGAFDYLSIINWFKVLYYFLPYGLFLFGIIYDGLIEKIKFFPAGFVGLVAIYISSTISRVAGFNTTDTDLCGIPGMSGWGSDIAPQNIVFVSAILSYIATYITLKRETIEIMSSGASWIGLAIVWIIQAVVFNMTGCNDPTRWVGGSNIAGKFLVPFIGLIFGGAIGSLFGWVFSTYVSVGSGISSDQQQALLGGSKSTGPAMGSTADTSGAGKCSPTDSDDQFVCEAYKNGELVTSTIVE